MSILLLPWPLLGCSRFLPSRVFIEGYEHSSGCYMSIAWLVQVPHPIHNELFPGNPQVFTSLSAPGSPCTIWPSVGGFESISGPCKSLFPCDFTLFDSVQLCHLAFSSCKEKKQILAVFFQRGCFCFHNRGCTNMDVELTRSAVVLPRGSGSLSCHLCTYTC